MAFGPEDPWMKSVKAATKWGQCPVLHVGDQQIAQSKAIARYLGRMVNLDGKALYPTDIMQVHVVEFRV